jgi:DNA-binding XRE family transcriptional regulator
MTLRSSLPVPPPVGAPYPKHMPSPRGRRHWMYVARTYLKELHDKLPPSIEVGFWRYGQNSHVHIPELRRAGAAPGHRYAQLPADFFMVSAPTRIKIQRLKMRITQRELAKKAGLSRMQLSRIEQGRQKLSWRMAERLSAVLDLPMSFFIEPAKSN